VNAAHRRYHLTKIFSLSNTLLAGKDDWIITGIATS
jgi:hypothetical protein